MTRLVTELLSPSQIGPAIENLKYREEEENRERLQKRRYSY